MVIDESNCEERLVSSLFELSAIAWLLSWGTCSTVLELYFVIDSFESSSSLTGGITPFSIGLRFLVPKIADGTSDVLKLERWYVGSELKW